MKKRKNHNNNKTKQNKKRKQKMSRKNFGQNRKTKLEQHCLIF